MNQREPRRIFLVHHDVRHRARRRIGDPQRVAQRAAGTDGIRNVFLHHLQVRDLHDGVIACRHRPDPR